MTKHPWCSLVAPAHFPVSNLCPPALGGLSTPRPALPPWPLPLATHGMGGRCPELSGAESGWGSGSEGAVPAEGDNANPGSWSPAASVGLAAPKAHSAWQPAPRVELVGAAWHKSCRVFIFPRLLPRTVSCSPGLDRLWSELRENCRAHQGSKGPACPASGKDARYISAPACVASAQITSSCMIVVSP